MAYLIQYIFYLFPLLTVAFFIVSLISFLVATKKNKRIPGSVSDERIKLLRTLLTVSSVMAGVLLAIVVGFAIVLGMAVAYM